MIAFDQHGNLKHLNPNANYKATSSQFVTPTLYYGNQQLAESQKASFVSYGASSCKCIFKVV